jgi:hypothetical protein
MRRAALIAACVAICAIQAAPADAWLRISSANFELFTTAGEHAGRDLVRHFERVRSFFQQAFGLIPHDGNPVEIVVFRSAKEFEPYKLNEAASAYFESGFDHEFIVMQTAAPDHYPVAVHEYTHLLLHQAGRIPRWLNEGLAELYSTMQPRGADVLVGEVIPGRLATLQMERWLDLREVIAVDEHSPLYNERTHAGVFYAESWFLVHMLALQEWYAPRFRQLGAALQEGDTTAAFWEVYGKTVAQVQQDLQLYFRLPQLNGRLFPVRLPDSVDAPQVERAGFRARAALAEVINTVPNRRPAAQAACKELAREFPGRWETEQSCAEVAWRDRNWDESARHFARALELGADSARLDLNYGRVLAAAGRLPDAMAAMRTAIRKNAGWNEPHYELAIALVQTESYDEALREFAQVKKLPPGQAIRYYYNLAYTHYRLGDLASAKKLLDQAEPFAATDRDHKALDDLRAACCK